MNQVEGLFETPLKDKSMHPTNPLLIGLKSEFENNRSSIHADPKGSIELHFPIPMQTKADAISYKAEKMEVF